MASNLEYALLAGVAYRSTRADDNKFPAPPNWTELPNTYRRIDNSGFEAVTFTNGTETVISFAGTDSEAGYFAPDWQTNRALASGTWSEQLLQAAEYDLRGKLTNPTSSNNYTQLLRD